MYYARNLPWLGLVFVLSAGLAACGADTSAESDAENEDTLTEQMTSSTDEAPAETRVVAAAAKEPVCADCGTISSIQEKTEEGEGTGIGAVTGAVLGGVAGREIVKGDRDKRNIAGVVGAVAGGYAGHKIEEKARSKTYYQVNVGMDDGRTETVNLKSADGLSVGQKVRVQDGNIILP